ncbi:MAG TPA: aldo/keto reductase, partial [Terriglobales bacterium]|nr:aldo/keto reductase [Terriglobales bacterium]
MCSFDDLNSPISCNEKSTADSAVTRRRFVALAAMAAGLVPLSIKLGFGESETKAAGGKGEMQYRTLGRTGEKVSIIGVGGAHLGNQGVSDDEATRIVRAAIDNGINFMDNCWDYHDGRSEQRMGNALQNGYRQKVFLMTKIDGRDAKTATQQIDESLKRLKTDHVDLMQFHEIIRMNDPERIFAAGGAMEAMLAARKAGKVRYIGFTGHKDPKIHLHMLDVARQHNFHFDTVQMPLNVMDAHFDSFVQQVVPVAVKEEIGILGMKSMADKFILETKTATPVECLHYAMNLPTSVVITGIDSMDVLHQDLAAARDFRPMSKEQ